MSLTKATFSMIVGAPANVRDFGAVGDGVTDDAAAIQAADTYAAANGTSVFFDGADYLIKSPLTISAPWIGIPGASWIVMDATFSFPAPTFDPRNYSAITNLHCAAAYNSATADYVYIENMSFRNNSTSVLDIVAVANVRGGAFVNCQFQADANGVCTPVDLFACVKNFTVNQCTIRNYTEFNGGGGMWVRNITGDGADFDNITENIAVTNCYIEQTGLDEALAVYGVLGLVRNVKVSLCTFDGTVASAQKHGNLVTVFPLGNGANAAVENVTFSACTFKSNNFVSAVARVGQTGDELFVCKNVRFENCYFEADLPAAGTAHVVRNIANTGGNITIANCTVNAENSTNVIESGVLGMDNASNVTVTGNLTNAFNNCDVVDGCTVNNLATAGKGALNCGLVQNCVMTAANTIVSNTLTGKYDVRNCNFTLTSTSGVNYAVLYNSISGSAPYGEIHNNTFSLNNTDAFAIRVSGTGTGSTTVNNNTVLGTGKTISASQLKEMQGNNWYGSLDSVRSAGYLNFDHNVATPIGTYATAITHTAGANSYLLGFIKIANAGVSGDWVNVYAGNTLT